MRERLIILRQCIFIIFFSLSLFRKNKFDPISDFFFFNIKVEANGIYKKYFQRVSKIRGYRGNCFNTRKTEGKIINFVEYN